MLVVLLECWIPIILLDWRLREVGRSGSLGDEGVGGARRT